MKKALLSTKAIGTYGTILGIVLSTAYGEMKARSSEFKAGAVQDYKLSQFDPEEFIKMRISIEVMREDIRDIKKILSRGSIASNP